MNTYLLTGNPQDGKEGGMDRQRYQDIYDEAKRQGGPGFANGHWTMANSKSKADEQIVLLRTGDEKPGLVGFGLRLEGHPEVGWNDRQEYPVRFYNLKSWDDEPYISRRKLRDRGFWREGNFPSSGTLLTPEELDALEKCCEEEISVPLAKLCGVPYALASSVIDTRGISSEVDAGPTTGPVPSDWTGVVTRNAGLAAATYALRFGDRSLWKIGHAQDLEGRLDEINKHVPTEVLDECWEFALLQRWPDSLFAREMEQKVLELLASSRTVGERVMCSKSDLEAAWTSAAAAVKAARRDKPAAGT